MKKKNKLLYSMCLSLNAIAMQSEGFDQANTPSNLVHQAAANASGVTSPGTPVSLDRLMAMMLSMQNRINVDGAAIGELRDTIEKQNATIGAERAQHKIDIGELHARIEAERTQLFNHWQFTRVEPVTQEATKRLGAEEQAARRTTRRTGNDEATK